MNLLRKLLTLLVLLATIAVGVLFALQNTVPVPLDLLVYTFAEKSLALWVLAAFAVGGVVGMLTAMGIVVSLRTALRAANKKATKANLELDKLRTAGLKPVE
ncbi:MAG: lipopolysaccharide assembly protein LapA domain-containing protein [Halioglobus sp.]